MRIQRDQRGFTLIEMLVVITLGAIVLGLCVMLTQSLLRLNRAGQARLTEGSALGRLSRTFRDDVRSALEANTDPEDAKGPARLTLTMPDRQILEYRFEGNALLRLGRVEGEVDRVDRFRLPGRATIRPEVRDDQGQTFVSLILDSPTDSRSRSALRGTRIEAVLGLDRRFEKEDLK
jgi:prepilin-type N-terminal cleavage/methylation domain-containing protein